MKQIYTNVIDQYTEPAQEKLASAFIVTAAIVMSNLAVCSLLFLVYILF